MTWTLTSAKLSQNELLQEESLFFLGNGYLGVRGNFEEGYQVGFTSIRGTYMNAFHDTTKITYGEKLYGFPDVQQTMVNMTDAQGIRIAIGEEHFSLFSGDVLSYERKLHMDKGYAERLIHWRSPKGHEFKFTFRRAVSFDVKELFAIQLTIEPINYHGLVTITSTINGNVENFTDPNDPRLASDHAKHLHVIKSLEKNGIVSIITETNATKLRTACATTYTVDIEHQMEHTVQEHRVITQCSFELTKPVVFTKWNAYTDTLRHGSLLIEEATKALQAFTDFESLLAAQEAYLADFWKDADVKIGGDPALQEGIRFNLYHLLQSTGRDFYSNIAAKGLSGEGYEGHYFWDTEIYMLPVFLLTKPELAKHLLLYRHHILDGARAHANIMGHSKGALFPWRTISGTESSAYFPSGSAQYHISADVAYSYIQYFLVTNDIEFMEQYGAEVLFETARLWVDAGHFLGNRFVINNVTGPDEYTCLVNNNYYTNIMAKYNLKWAASIYRLLAEDHAEALQAIAEKIELLPEEAAEWQRAADLMYLPYDADKDINPQDDSFLEKTVWNFEHTPKENYPLLLHYHPLALYRRQVCKQADTVLSHFLLEDEHDFSTIKHSYDYYEKITTHDSSLSHCIFSIMASKVGYHEKAYDYFIETARLDLDNIHGNTRDGLHMANMGGTWMAIVYGFAGLRIKESGLELSPSLPKQWESYQFTITYQGRKLSITVHRESLTVKLLEGDALSMTIYGQPIDLHSESTVTYLFQGHSRQPVYSLKDHMQTQIKEPFTAEIASVSV
ncbi:glycoside hydrolase family 65 protein [Bacillus testis]|uniref:glycoside hydrolase family 65 protein n=1 Tax=Bacillus testis TaxID=1622072 RepID=UPI0009462BC7|nr:glycosyl hydrolase family 65 protein [Bacillus testis]